MTGLRSFPPRASLRTLLAASPMRLSKLLRPTLGLALLAGCSDPPTLSIEVTTGHEEGSLKADPAVAEVKIVGKSADGEVTRTATAKVGGSFDMGEVPDTSIMTFELTGTSADGNVIARGRSVSVPVGAVDADVLSLFIQRTGAFARPPGELTRSHVHAPGGVVGERFLVATGGDTAVGASGPADPAFGDYYDMLGLTGTESDASLPRAAKSLVVRDTTLLLIDDAGASSAVLDQATTQELSPPDGLTFADVSGGVAFDLPGGTTLVVGATRPDGPTAAVLAVDTTGTMTALSLTTPRAGAAVAYVDGQGLVVAGGSADGAGVEVIGDDLSVRSLPFPADATTGAAAVTFVENQLVLIGGRLAGAAAPTRVYELTCAAACDPGTTFYQLVPAADVPELAARGRAFAVTNAALTIGETDAGETVAFRVSIGESTVTALPLREPRFGATPIPAPNGTLALVGGVTDVGSPVRSVEIFFPE